MKTPILLRAPWPPRECSPNVRTHWAKKHRAVKSYRFAVGCFVRAQLQEQNHKWVGKEPALDVLLRCTPPTQRRRDRDNMLASMKALLDTVAEELGVDDYVFRPHVVMEEPALMPGVVLVLRPAAALPPMD